MGAQQVYKDETAERKRLDGYFDGVDTENRRIETELRDLQVRVACCCLLRVPAWLCSWRSCHGPVRLPLPGVLLRLNPEFVCLALFSLCLRVCLCVIVCLTSSDVRCGCCPRPHSSLGLRFPPPHSAHPGESGFIEPWLMLPP